MINIIAPILLAVSGSGAQSEKAFDKPELGSRVTKKRTKVRDGRHYMNLYAKCVEGRHRKKTEEMLKAESFSEQQFELLQQIAGLHKRSSCTITDIAFDTVTMRGAVAEQWYISNYPNSAPTELKTAQAYLPDLMESVKRIVAVPDNVRGRIVIEEFAICVAATQPLKVDQLLRTTVNTGEEKRVVSELSANFGQCAIEGQKLKFNYETLRAGLGYALARKTLGFVPNAEKVDVAEAPN